MQADQKDSEARRAWTVDRVRQTVGAKSATIKERVTRSRFHARRMGLKVSEAGHWQLLGLDNLRKRDISRPRRHFT